MNDRDQRRRDRLARVQTLGRENVAGFVKDLRADREALRAVNAHNRGETREVVGNTTRTGHILGEATGAAREFGTIMNSQYARRPEKLRARQSTGRFERAPRREKKADALAPAEPNP